MSINRLYHFLLVSMICGFPFLTKGQFHRCATNEARLERPNWQEKRAYAEEIIQNWQNLNTLEARSIITIPIVIHIVWNKEEENISDEQIFSQLESLNQDFRSTNIEVANVLTEFKSFISDTGIEFCLVQEDYRGRSTTGITRTFTNEEGIAGNDALIKNGSFGGTDAWDTKRFLNIWVGRRDDHILGEATIPGEAEDWEDGIVIDYRSFGSLGTAANNEPYNLGRTLTHEVGHYLGLQHLWGEEFDNALCLYDDGLEDTPVQRFTYANQCPNRSMSSCASSDMYMNFMNYTNDACMSMFTIQQSTRMLAVLNTIRKDLQNAGKSCGIVDNTDFTLPSNVVTIAPNPVSKQVFIHINDYTKPLSAELYNPLGKVVNRFKVLPSQAYFLNVQTYSSGIYYLRLYNDNQYITKPITIHPN